MTDDESKLRVNKREMAGILECAPATIDKLIDRYPDFPIERRGTIGTEWEFDADRVVSFLRQQREVEARASAARSDLMRQFNLPIDDGVAAGGISWHIPRTTQGAR